MGPIEEGPKYEVRVVIAFNFLFGLVVFQDVTSLLDYPEFSVKDVCLTVHDWD